MATKHPRKPERRSYWLDEPRNVDKLVYLVYGICVGLLFADLLYDKHPHFAVEGWLDFYGFYGFASYTALIFIAKALRKLVRRREDYYDE